MTPTITVQEVKSPEEVRKMAADYLLKQGIDVRSFYEHDLIVIVAALRSYIDSKL